MPTFPQYLSTSQAGERLGMSREHVRRLIQRGELRADETVKGFMVHIDEVERFAAIRQIQRDQREFRSAVDDLLIKTRHVEGADAFGSAVAAMRDEMNVCSAFELPTAIASQVVWMNQEVTAQKALAVLADPAEAIVERWRRYDEDVRHAKENVISGVSASEKPMPAMNRDAQQVTVSGNDADALWQNERQRRDQEEERHQREALEEFRRRGAAGHQGAYSGQFSGRDLSDTGAGANAAMPKRPEDHLAALGQKGNPLTATPLRGSRPPELARGFVVPESRTERWEEKMDALSRTVEQLTEVVMQQRAATGAEIPTWQEWAGSDRPEDVLAKLAAIREETSGGKQTDENSTDVIREAREARGGDA